MSCPQWSRVTVVDGAVVDSEHSASVSSDRYTAIWTGFLYADDGVSNTACLERLLRDLQQGTPIDQAVARLRGSFFLAVQDRTAQVVYCLVDDSGLFSAYRSRAGAATSFLALCRASGVHSNSFDRAAMIEMLHLGNVYFGDTLSPAVKKIASNEIVASSATETHVIPKPIARLCDAPRYPTIEDATQPLAKALRNMNVSVDLTGGFDSRMLACLLVHHQVAFEAALSGLETNADSMIGQQVAQALGRPYFFTDYRGEGLLDELEYTLERLDGMGGRILVNHRLRKLNEDRIARGATIALKGSGGELYKEFFWTQDFPFYRSSKTGMGRLSRLRLEFELLTPTLLTERAFQEYTDLRAARRRRLSERYSMPINTQSYDNVYFYERVQTWNSRTITSTQDPRLAIHAPLCELQVAQIGFRAPRSKRFYNRFHREVITSAVPRAAQVITTDGTSASAGAVDILRDAFGHGRGKAKKLAKKISQVLLNQTKFVPAAYSPDLALLREIATSATGQQALQTLKDADLLRTNVAFDDISPRFREHLVSLGWTLARLA
jgi:asparagine synthetase B (glutamine-hydrolysing)